MQTKKQENSEYSRELDDIKKDIISGSLNDEVIEVEVKEQPKQVNMMGGGGIMGMEINMADLVDGVMGKTRKKRKKLSIADAKKLLIQEESEKLKTQTSKN